MNETEVYDLRVTVERIEGRSVCGLEVGDWFEVTESSRVRIPEGKHFCLLCAERRPADPAREAAQAPGRRLARTGQPLRLPGSGRACDHADRAPAAADDPHVRTDVRARELGLGLQSDKRPGSYGALAVQAEADGFDVVTVFHDLFFSLRSRRCSRSRERPHASGWALRA